MPERDKTRDRLGLGLLLLSTLQQPRHADLVLPGSLHKMAVWYYYPTVTMFSTPTI
jgi:hypothetical protein